MQGKGGPLNPDVVCPTQSLNTHGAEVAPGSYVVGEDLQNHRLAHDDLLEEPFLGFSLRHRGQEGHLGEDEAAIRPSLRSVVAPREKPPKWCERGDSNPHRSPHWILRKVSPRFY